MGENMKESLKILICPLCGSSSKKKKFINFFCEDCWLSKQKVKLPEKIIIQKCKSCGRLKIRKWNLNIEDLKKEIFSVNKFITEIKELNEKSCKIVFTFDDTKVEREIPVEFKSTLCDECTKRIRGYYEAVIQLRSMDKKIYNEKRKDFIRFKNEIVNELEKITFVPLVKEEKYGFDIYVGSTQKAFETLKNLGLKYKSTKKLFTKKKGKNLYRTTFLVKLN